MKKLLLILILINLCTFLFSQEVTKRALLINFESKTSGEYVLEDNIKSLLFNSFYSYLSIFPFLKTPPKREMQTLKTHNMRPVDIARKFKSDYLIFGEFTLSGDALAPNVSITVKVWSLDKKDYILTKTISSKIDLDIFDSIDTVTSESLVTAFNITSGFAQIDFLNFKIGSGKYELFVNNKKKADITNENFNLSLRVLGDMRYKIAIKHKRFGLRYKTFIKVPRGKSTIISYNAITDVYLDKLVDKDSREKYVISFNNKQVNPKTRILNIPAGITHDLIVLNSSGKTVSSNAILIQDKKINTILPSASHLVRLHPSLSFSWKNQFTKPEGINPASGSFFNKIQTPLLGPLLDMQYYITKNLSLTLGLAWYSIKYDVQGVNFTNVIINHFVVPFRVGFTPGGIMRKNRYPAFGIVIDTQFLRTRYNGYPSESATSIFTKTFVQFGVFLQYTGYKGLTYSLTAFLPTRQTLTDTGSGHYIEIDNALNFKWDVGYRLVLW